MHNMQYHYQPLTILLSVVAPVIIILYLQNKMGFIFTEVEFRLNLDEKNNLQRY